jgi:hypothetical protein
VRGHATDAGLARYTARGAAVGVGGYSTRYVSRSALTTQAGYVRNSWIHTSCFTPGWYRTYPGAWRAARWVAAASVWAAPVYGGVATWCDLPPEPVYYDYGSSVVFRDGEVYVDGDQTVPVEVYAHQATNLADAGSAEPKEMDEWQPLGVFAIVQGDEKTSNQVFQLAVNKEGLIRGNYYDALADNVLPVTGKVSKKSQRAAWTIGKRKDTVYEAGIANLTRKETPMLVHFAKKGSQQWTLVRIEEPKDQE